jgi:hypothetical protein
MTNQPNQPTGELKMIDLQQLPAAEAERLAYAEGFTGTARLFARLADLQQALGKATAEITDLQDQICDLTSRLADMEADE